MWCPDGSPYAAADRATRTEGEGKGGRSTRGPTESTLETTAHHPFWDATTGDWVDAAELTPGTSTLVGPDGQIQYVTKVRNFTGTKVMRDLTVDTTHTYYVIAGNQPVLVHNNDPGLINLGVSGDSCPVNADSISIYRTPKVDDKDFELGNGPNPAMQNVKGSNGQIYFGEASVAAEYQGRGTFAPGSIRYDMHPSFLERFPDAAKRYDWKGPNGAPRIEFEIPFARLNEFNSLTRGRVWIPMKPRRRA